MIDSHIHIDSEIYQNEIGIDNLLNAAASAGVTRVVAPALHLDSFKALMTISEVHNEVYPAAGVHPHEVSSERCEGLTESLVESLARMTHPLVGETGLEGHYDFVPMDLQLQSLRSHLDVCKAHGIPIILHCRDAEQLLYNELKGAGLSAGGVIHCFTGTWNWAERFLELGFHIGITGIVTFKKSTQVQEVARSLPIDRILVETDGPYLAPSPYRGKTNKPEYIPLIIEKIAQLRDISATELGARTVENTEKVFRLTKAQ